MNMKERRSLQPDHDIERYSIVSREAFEIYAVNHEMDALEYILDLDCYSYHMMNILDYLVGNTDRHWETGDFGR